MSGGDYDWSNLTRHLNSLPPGTAVRFEIVNPPNWDDWDDERWRDDDRTVVTLQLGDSLAESLDISNHSHQPCRWPSVSCHPCQAVANWREWMAAR